MFSSVDNNPWYSHEFLARQLRPPFIGWNMCDFRIDKGQDDCHTRKHDMTETTGLKRKSPNQEMVMGIHG